MKTLQNEKVFERFEGIYGRLGLLKDAPRFFGIVAYQNIENEYPDHRFTMQSLN